MDPGDHLPDELLLEIFSYVTFDDLILSIQFVCSRWRDVIQDDLLWRDRVYYPNCNASDDVIAYKMKLAPKLQAIHLEKRGVRGWVLDSIAQNCPNLRKLKLNPFQKLNTRRLKTLFSNCPNIEWLSLPRNVFHMDKQIKIVAQFTKLKTLKIARWTRDDVPCSVVRSIADGCPALQHLYLGLEYISHNDLKYFLDKKGAQLHTLGIRWDNADLKCNIPLLIGYSSLKSLRINLFLDVETQVGFQSLRKLKNLSSLVLDSLEYAEVNYVMWIFQDRAMDQLEELHISSYYRYHDRLAEVIVNNCPKLKVLWLVDCSNFTDISLKNLYTLQTLEEVNLRYLSISDTGITYLKKCENLRYLNMDNCSFTEEGMKVLIDIRQLKVLKMCAGDVRGFPFHLVPICLSNLTLLNINYCRNVDEDAVNELRSSVPHLEIHAHPLEPLQSDYDTDYELDLEDANFLFEP